MPLPAVHYQLTAHLHLGRQVLTTAQEFYLERAPKVAATCGIHLVPVLILAMLHRGLMIRGGNAVPEQQEGNKYRSRILPFIDTEGKVAQWVQVVLGAMGT